MSESTAPQEERVAIRAKLERYGVLHKEMAEACNVSKATISAWLKGDVSSPALDKAIPAFVRGIEIGKEQQRAA